MPDTKFSHDDYDRLIKQTIGEILKLSTLKGGEYAGDVDRLANFRRNGLQVGVPMETCWAIYYNKHHDAVMQWVQDLSTGKKRDRLEPIAGRVDDMIVYLILLKAMLVERGLLRLGPSPSDPLGQAAEDGHRFMQIALGNGLRMTPKQHEVLQRDNQRHYPADTQEPYDAGVPRA